MPSTTALFTGLSGLSVNARQLDVIGNNIANVNTSGYKANRMLFAPTFSRTFSAGTSPGAFTGGTNPLQVGNGATIGATQLYDLFKKIEMSREVFNFRAFTRLKQLEYLLRLGQLDDQLFWRA